MTNINKSIGMNIRLVRTVRRMTMHQLSALLNELGDESVTAHKIGTWERGQVRMTAEQILLCSQALKCSIAELYHGDKYITDVRIVHELHSLPQNEKYILANAVISWNGDVHALINCMGLYMSFEQKERAQIAEECLHFYRKMVRQGRSLHLPVDISLIKQKTRELHK